MRTKQIRKPRQDPRRVGGRYFCGYWRQEYTVLAIRCGEHGVPTFTVRWADGHTNSHRTAWDWRWDKVVRSHEDSAESLVIVNQHSAGFWSASDGWGALENATEFAPWGNELIAMPKGGYWATYELARELEAAWLERAGMMF